MIAYNNREIIQWLRDEYGVRPEVRQRGKHPYLVFDYLGVPYRISVSKTPSDYRAINNLIAELRRKLGQPPKANGGEAAPQEAETETEATPAAAPIPPDEDAPAAVTWNGQRFRHAGKLAEYLAQRFKLTVRQVRRIIHRHHGDIDAAAAEMISPMPAESAKPVYWDGEYYPNRRLFMRKLAEQLNETYTRVHSCLYKHGWNIEAALADLTTPSPTPFVMTPAPQTAGAYVGKVVTAALGPKLDPAKITETPPSMEETPMARFLADPSGGIRDTEPVPATRRNAADDGSMEAHDRATAWTEAPSKPPPVKEAPSVEEETPAAPSEPPMPFHPGTYRVTSTQVPRNAKPVVWRGQTWPSRAAFIEAVANSPEAREQRIDKRDVDHTLYRWRWDAEAALNDLRKYPPTPGQNKEGVPLLYRGLSYSHKAVLRKQLMSEYGFDYATTNLIIGPLSGDVTERIEEYCAHFGHKRREPVKTATPPDSIKPVEREPLPPEPPAAPEPPPAPPPVMLSVYAELLDTATRGQFAPDADNSDNEHLGRLAKAISRVTKEEFEVMSTEAQRWFDAAADALNAEKDVPPPDGYDRPGSRSQAPETEDFDLPGTCTPASAPESVPEPEPVQPAAMQAAPPGDKRILRAMLNYLIRTEAQTDWRLAKDAGGWFFRASDIRPDEA